MPVLVEGSSEGLPPHSDPEARALQLAKVVHAQMISSPERSWPVEVGDGRIDSVAELLDGHIAQEVECLDRI